MSRRAHESPADLSAAGHLLRWSLTVTSTFVDLSPNTIREQIRKGEFPPRVTVGGKEQFIPDEVRAWAAGRDWRAMVTTRLQTEVSRAS